MRPDLPLLALLATNLLVFGKDTASRLSLGKLHDELVEASFELLIDGRLEGTGFLVDKDGHADTVWHAAGREGKLEIRSRALGRLNVVRVGHDRSHDLTLLKLPCRDEPYPFLPIAKQGVGPGQPIYLLGTPIFRHRVFITGHVARRGTTFEYFNGNFVEGIHVTAITPGGCSGGPWVNRQGHVVGMQAASMTLKAGHQGIATMIPAKSIREILEKKADILATSLDMAVEELWGQEVKYISKVPKGKKGLVVRQLKKEGTAAKAGVKEWDFVTNVDGRNIDETNTFIRHLRRKKLGDHLKMEVMNRDGSDKRQVRIKLVPLR